MKIIRRILSWLALCASSFVFTFVVGLFVAMTYRLFHSGTAVLVIVVLTQGLMTLGLFLVLGTMGAVLSKELSEMAAPSPHGIRYHVMGGLFVLDFLWRLVTRGMVDLWIGLAMGVNLAYGITLIILGIQSHLATREEEALAREEGEGEREL